MNNNVSHNHRLFVDRPMTGKVIRVNRVSTLRLLTTENSDLADGAMRLFLVICLLASLVLGGLRMNADHGVTTNDVVNRESSLSLPSVSKVVPSLPALPTVQYGVSIR